MENRNYSVKIVASDRLKNFIKLYKTTKRPNFEISFDVFDVTIAECIRLCNEIQSKIHSRYDIHRVISQKKDQDKYLGL